MDTGVLRFSHIFQRAITLGCIARERTDKGIRAGLIRFRFASAGDRRIDSNGASADIQGDCDTFIPFSHYIFSDSICREVQRRFRARRAPNDDSVEAARVATDSEKGLREFSSGEANCSEPL